MSTESATPESTDLNPRRWAILAVLVTSLLVVVLDNTVLNVALPTIQEELGASQEELVWAINSYTCVFAALLFTWGVLGDRYGRKRILIIGLLSFGLASLLTAYAADPQQLIIFRGVLGAAGASVLPVTLAIITVVFPPHERGKAIGMWAAAVGGAVAIGPVLGGVLVENFWWGSVFLINVPIVILGVIGIWLLVPESKNPRPGRLDPLGVVLSVSGLLLLTFGILRGGDSGEWGSIEVLGPLVGGVALVAVFVWIEWRSDHPSLDLSLFQIRSFSVPLAAVSLSFAALSGTLIFLSFYLQIVRDFSALQAGLCILPVAVGQLLAAPRSGSMVSAFGARRVIGVGLSIVTVVFVGIAFLTTETPLWIVLVLFFFLGFGLGNVIAPCTTRMTLATPPARSGAGSAVQNTLRQVGGALGIAVISSVVAVVYSDRIAPALSGLPPNAAGAAEDSVGATYEVAKQIGGDAADALRAAGAQAFLTSLRWGALISATLVVLALFLVVWRLPAKAEAVDWAGGSGGAGRPPGPGSRTDHEDSSGRAPVTAPDRE
ncbi:MAG: MFS transporter [Candidatus Nanopelagicales bacterium]